VQSGPDGRGNLGPDGRGNLGPELGPLVPGAKVLVVGAGVTGRAVLKALTPLGALGDLTDDRPMALEPFAYDGVRVIDAESAAARVGEYALVVVSPGLPPDAPVPVAAAAAGVPVWGDVELAWRLDQSGRYGPPRRWLVVTGTNGKTTTTSMLQAMLTAAGRRSLLCGNIGDPVLDVLDQPSELLAVELSSFQLFWSSSLRPEAGVVLNVAEDHLDWHGSLDHYAAAKAKVLTGRVAVAGLDDPIATELLAEAAAPVKLGFRLGVPGPGELGARDGMLVGADGAVLAPVDSIAVAGPVGVLNALAAAALARAVDVPAEAIATALPEFQVGRHRAEVVAVADGVTYVNDSKATNPHAAEASVLAHPRVVWVAGGLLKGASVEATVARIADRLAGVVVLGRDRAVIAQAIARHAPDVPIVAVVTGEDAEVHGATVVKETEVSFVTRVIDASGAAGVSLGERVMTEVVAAARDLASPGDTVLLAPAGASFDQFNSYAHRGDTFAAAVRAITG
jgi:UDP-N-acetylmuramoylalanine--D-glutamate ligase